MSEPLRIQGLLAKTETTYGTDAAPSNSVDGVRVIGFSWTDLSGGFAFLNRRDDVNSGSLFPVAPGAPRGRIRTFEIRVQLMGAGAAYDDSPRVVPECAPLLRACAMSEAIVTTGGSESVTYALVSTPHDSATIWVYAGKKLFKLVGCRGTWTWSPTAGGLGEITFRMMGMLSTAPTNSTVPSITYASVTPPAAVAMGLAIVPFGQSSWTPRVGNLEIVAGVEPQQLDDVNSADGIEGFFISSLLASRIRVPARVKDLSVYDAYAYAASALTHTIDLTLGTGIQYNRVKLDVNNAYLEDDPGHGEDQGFAAYDLEYRLRDLALVFD